MLLFVKVPFLLTPAVFREMTNFVTVIAFDFGHVKLLSFESRIWILFLNILLWVSMRERSSPSSFEFR